MIFGVHCGLVDQTNFQFSNNGHSPKVDLLISYTSSPAGGDPWTISGTYLLAIDDEVLGNDSQEMGVIAIDGFDEAYVSIAVAQTIVNAPLETNLGFNQGYQFFGGDGTDEDPFFTLKIGWTKQASPGGLWVPGNVGNITIMQDYVASA